MTTDTISELRELLSQALAWSNYCIGEGLVGGGNVEAPEDAFYDYANATGDEDYDTYAERLPALLLNRVEAAEKERDEARARVINSPETADFMAGVPLEAAHQRERWGADHDAGKSPFDWFWLIGYLAQKAADAAVRGDAEKAKHHTISTAAALANWHAALAGTDTRMRPGIDATALGHPHG